MTKSQADYQSYLKSPHWVAISAEVKRRAGYRCQVCDSPHDLQAHHRRYDNRGNEQMSDLICLCRRCHEVFHGKAKPIKSPKAQNGGVGIGQAVETPANAPKTHTLAIAATTAIDKMPRGTKGAVRNFIVQNVESLIGEETIMCDGVISKRVRAAGAAWHWLKKNGYHPNRRGWRRRLVGKMIPVSILKQD